MLKDIVHDQPHLHRNYLRQIKSTLGGIFSEARRLELITSEPMRGVRLPAAVQGESRGYYSLEEIKKMLALLDGKIALAVATAAYTGMRRAELQGFKWQDYDGSNIYVRRNVVSGKESPPKTKSSGAAIPVIAPLKRLLDEYRKEANSEFVFATAHGGWLHFGYLAKQHVIPVLKQIGIAWKGWHAFRRGLATNLYALGVSDKVVQAILRHSNLATTLNIYVHTSPEDSIEAMGKLEKALTATIPAMVQ